MGDTTSKENVQSKGFFRGLKAEFSKIIWPDKDTVVKQTIAVIAASVSLGLIIALIDMVLKFGLSFILK